MPDVPSKRQEISFKLHSTHTDLDLESPGSTRLISWSWELTVGETDMRRGNCTPRCKCNDKTRLRV